MPITETDLVFLESERMDDTAAGGGRMTGNVIADGEENNIFPDIAPTDRVMGRVRLGKIFAANRSADTSLYLGAHLAISHRPADPAVDVILFAPGSWTDTRSEARDYVERYLVRGPYWPGWLYGNHLSGQRAVQLYQLEETELPSVGQTVILIQDEGLVAEIEQYARITKVEEEIRTFIDAIGTFRRRVVTLAISDALRADFVGEEVERITAKNPRSRIRDTVAAAAAHYYSTRPLAQAALTGERTVWVDTLYGQLVPSAQTETPLVDLDAVGAALPLTVSGGALSLTTSAPLSPTAALYLGAGIVQGSLTLVTGATTLTDNSRGDLLSGSTVVGAIDYTEGVLTGVSGGPTYGSRKVVTWTPAAAPRAVSLSAGIAVSAETRGLNWTIALLPIPAAGTLRVDYQVAGKWYRLADRGDGGLVGPTSAHGAGSLSFTTGSVLVTCGALPDVGSEILFLWAQATDAIDRSDDPMAPPEIRATLAHGNVVPGTLELSWTAGGEARTATDDALGAIAGDATGTVDYVSGDLVLIPALLPAPGAEIAAEYERVPVSGVWRTETFVDPTVAPDGTVSLALTQTDVVPGSVKVTWNLVAVVPADLPADLRPQFLYNQMSHYAADLGNGTLHVPNGADGTIDYGAGTVQFAPEADRTFLLPQYHDLQMGVDFAGLPVYRAVIVGWSTVAGSAMLPDDGNGHVVVSYMTPYGVGTPTSETLAVEALAVPLPKGTAETLVPGATRFSVGGRTYTERYRSLYFGLDPATGAGTLGGGLDYGSGVASLSDWAADVAPAPTLDLLLTQLQLTATDETCFRVAVAPVRPGSLAVRATPLLFGAAVINVTAALDGSIYQAGAVDGAINYATGVVRIRWGGWVIDADLTPEEKAEVWYDPDAVVEIEGVDMIFKPRPVYADTVVYNAVGYSYLPLNADLLGLDPVRLPTDGRVPVLQTGDLALILHHHAVEVASPAAGGTVDTTLTGVARVRVFDANGLALAADRYSLAQDTGIVTWATPLDLTGTTAPYTVEATIEDAALVVDADISGQLTLNRALTHDFPEEALVASAYLFGDLFAQASTPFAQQAWTSVWSDERIGNPILAQYNNLLYPIELSNASSWRERWALLFTSTTSFRVIGETLGDITDQLGGFGYHDIDHDLAPVNPLTSTPYFTLAWEGWGSGWVAGNVLRFNILPPANFPAWLALTVQPSAPTTGQDRFRLLLRGGIDA